MFTSNSNNLTNDKTQEEQIHIIDLSLKVLTFDYLLRWISLGSYRLIFGESVQGSHLVFFFSLQLVIIIFTLCFVFWREYIYRVNNNSEYSIPDSVELIWKQFWESIYKKRKYEIVGSSFSMLLRFFFVVTFTYMVVSASFDKIVFDGYKANLIGFVGTVSFFVYGIWIYFISHFSVPDSEFRPVQALISAASRRKDNLSELLESDLQAHRMDEVDNNPIDTNDTEILEIEGEVRNLMNRVEAYILESVMFGALTFSGFLTIIASDTDRLNYVSMRRFGYNIVEFMLDLIVFEFKRLEEYHIFSTDPEHLLVLIMFQTVLCALFFLMVIAARLKFSKTAEQIDNTVRLARSYNNKEEEVYILKLQSPHNTLLDKRLLVLNRKISQLVLQAADLIKEIHPVIAYMSFLRNMGVLFFLFIIITSLLFFNTTVAIFFGAMSLTAYVYKQFDTWYRQKRMQRIINQHQGNEQLAVEKVEQKVSVV
jgi:hypothetical protein